MTITTSYISDAFKKYNKKYFYSKLPVPVFMVVTTKSFLGQFGTRNGKHFIKISNYYVRSANEFDQTIIHEMIHMYLRVTGKEDVRKPHGKEFLNECKRINKDGWNLARTSTVSHRILSEDAKKKIEKGTIKNYTIFGYKTFDGKYFVFKSCQSQVDNFIKYFKKHCGFFADFFKFTTTDDTYANWTACQSKIKGYYVSRATYNTMKIFHRGFKRLAT